MLAIVQTIAVGLLALATSTGAVGSGAEETLPDRSEYLRVAEPELRHLVADGLLRSETFQRMVTDVGRSRWLVYVQRGPCPEKAAVACLLDVVGTYHGRRYVRVLVSYKGRHADSVIATLGHELQHVLEVAQEPAVTDRASMRDLFRRIGTVRIRGARTTVYETARAQAAGDQVSRELRRAGRRGTERDAVARGGS